MTKQPDPTCGDGKPLERLFKNLWERYMISQFSLRGCLPRQVNLEANQFFELLSWGKA